MRMAFIAQARMTSSRLPGKMGKDICGEPALYRMIERIRLTKHKEMDIIVATTTNKDDDMLVDIARKCNVKVFRGSENNVLERFYYAAKENEIDIIARITCDELLFDPRWLFDKLLDEFINENKYDYYTSAYFDSNLNKWIENEPCCGCGVEIFTFSALEKCYKETKNPYCLEHVTPYLYMNPDLFKCGGHSSNYIGPNILPKKFGTSLDTIEDLKFIRNIYEILYKNNKKFSTKEIIDVCIKNPNWNIEIENIERTPVTYRGENEKKTGWEWH